MIRNIFKFISFNLLLSLVFSINTAWAAPNSPITMLDTTAQQVIEGLKQNKSNLKSNPQIVYGLVNRYLLPHVDVFGMSRSVLGRNAWNNATAAQRQQFTQEFTKLVVRTYSGALAEYTNETVKFKPIRGGYEGKSFVIVDSVIVRQNAKDIPLSYNLVLKGNTWKIYDMSVEGVSLLQSFRSQFSVELSQGDMNSLISNLTKHNIKKQS